MDTKSPEELVAEHHAGRYAGLLDIAIYFLKGHRDAFGLCSDEAVVEAACEEGLTEAEITAALMHERGEIPHPKPARRSATVARKTKKMPAYEP
jgi:hypothetical protein